MVSSNDAAIMTNSTMTDDEIEKLMLAFEASAQFDDYGDEYWLARDLQKLFDYAKWENFEIVLKRSMVACQQSGSQSQDHWLPEIRKSISGKGRTEEVTDFKMSRYACYLTAQNADARKQPVAFAQTYFAIQTRRQELSERTTEAVPHSEDAKRVLIRNQVKEHNRYLASAAKNSGVTTPQEFAIFHSQGYQGQYGMTVPQIRQRRGLSKTADILDRMGSTELAANFFRVTQTEEKLRKDNIKGAKAAYATHYAVGRQVRDAMLKISGIAPEDLPVADNIKKAEKRLKNEQANTPQHIQQSHAGLHNYVEIVEAEQEAQATPIDDRKPINLRKDLWKFALLLMAISPDGKISTSELIAELPNYRITELPNYIHIPADSQEPLSGRSDNKFSQLVRNLKSHKTSKTNFIYQGYAEDYEGGFRITATGRDFVREYFSE